MKHILYLATTETDKKCISQLCSKFWNVLCIRNNSDIQKILNTRTIDAVLYDVEAEGEDFICNINKLNCAFPHIPLVIVSRAVCLKLYELLQSFENVKALYTLPCSIKKLHTALLAYTHVPPCRKQQSVLETSLIGVSSEIQKLRNFITSVKDHCAPILLYGETGSGKGLAAHLIHRLSGKRCPYVVENMSCIPESLAESILFGTVKGSYTDAVNRAGLFEQAHGGTLFLDEIQCLSLRTQAKLLRVLDTKQFRRVGSAAVQHSDFRLICASNKNLIKMMKKGGFRSDLYYRINVVNFLISPLRKHREDIPPLAAAHLKKYNKRLTPNALSRLYAHSWRGNVRELFSCLDRAVYTVKKRGVIYDQDISL